MFDAGATRTMVAVTSPDGTTALIGLASACERFTTQVNLLAGQLGRIELSADGREAVQEVVERAVVAANLAAALTVGLTRPVYFAECPSYNAVSDAEWLPLTGGGHARHLTYQCELQPGHEGTHAAEVQGWRGRIVWIRWDGRTRELVDLAPCPDRAPDPDDPECLLFEGHVGEHRFG